MRTIKLAIIFAVSTVLASCTLEVPKPTTVQLIIYKSKTSSQVTTLPQSQQDKLVAWLAKHQSGWSNSYASYVPVIEVRLKHADGNTSVLNIRNANQIIAYGSFGQYEQEFDSAAISELRQAVGIR